MNNAAEIRESLMFQVKEHFPWILLSLFVVEGVTGMIPAINTDVDPSWKRCDFSR